MSLLNVIAHTGNGGTIGAPEAAPGYNFPVSGDIDFTDDDFQYSRPAYGGTGYWARSPHGFVEIRGSLTSMEVKVGGNWSGHGTQSDVEVFVDGVYNQSVTLTTNNTTESHAITLPGGTKIIKLVNGYTADDGVNINTPGYGVFVQGIVTSEDIEIKIPVEPSVKWVLVGDSITTGATADHPAATSFAAILRETKNVQVESWGARTLNTTDSTAADNMAEYLSQQLTGTSENVLFILLGTNNFGLLSQSKATYKTNYGNLLDALHAIRPDIQIVCVSPIDRTSYDTPNAGGATLEDYADAIQELLTTRAWADFIYGRDLVTLANLPDGLHPDQTGHEEMAANLLTAYNLL